MFVMQKQLNAFGLYLVWRQPLPQINIQATFLSQKSMIFIGQRMIPVSVVLFCIVLCCFRSVVFVLQQKQATANHLRRPLYNTVINKLQLFFSLFLFAFGCSFYLYLFVIINSFQKHIIIFLSIGKKNFRSLKIVFFSWSTALYVFSKNPFVS